MTYFIIIFTIFVLFLIMRSILIKKKSFNSVDDELWPFYLKSPLTKTEQSFYFYLKEALPDTIILSQVQLSRFLGVKKGSNNLQWFNRINRMSIDYLVCDMDFSVLAAIELDDKTHDKPSRVQADNKKNKALKDANVKLIRWYVTNQPDVKTIQLEVLGVSS